MRRRILDAGLFSVLMEMVLGVVGSWWVTWWELRVGSRARGKLSAAAAVPAVQLHPRQADQRQLSTESVIRASNSYKTCLITTCTPPLTDLSRAKQDIPVSRCSQSFISAIDPPTQFNPKKSFNTPIIIS